MLLKVAPAFALLNTPKSTHGENPLIHKSFSAKSGNGLIICASKGTNHKPLTGVVFEPFEELKKEFMLVPSLPQASLARQKYCDESEAAINEQIKWVFKKYFVIVLCFKSVGINELFLNFQCGIQCFLRLSCYVCLF